MTPNFSAKDTEEKAVQAHKNDSRSNDKAIVFF
jgi:hypothetical protein